MNWTHFSTVVAATILIATEVLALAFAGGWAIAGLFGLGDIGAYILEGAGVVLALYAVYAFWKAANRVEPVTR